MKHKKRKNKRLPLLHTEAKDGNEHNVKMLLDRGAVYDIDALDRNGKTALMWAIQNCNEAIMWLLLDNGSNIYLQNGYGRSSAVQMAVDNGESREKIVRKFLNVMRKKCLNDSQKLATELLSVGCPLYDVVLLKDVEVTRAMLAKGCSVNVNDSLSRKTALHNAVFLRDYETVKLLIVEYSADVNAVDSDGIIPFAYYGISDDSAQEIEMLKLFTSRNTSLTLRNRNGWLQCRSLLQFGKREAVRVLLQSNINWCAMDQFGYTPLLYLVCNNMLFCNQDIVEALRYKNIIAAEDRINEEILILASQNNITKLVEILLDKGVNPNSTNSYRHTSLMATAMRKIPEQDEQSKKTFMMLLQFGANPQTFIDGKTVFDYITVYSSFHLSEFALAELAINECFGELLDDRVQNTINSSEFFKLQFELSKQQIERMKNTIIRDKISLFEILTADERILSVYARNDEFTNQWISSNEGCPNTYYSNILQKKFEKTLRIVRHRKNIDDLICKVMGISYDSYPAIVDKITNYIML